MLLMMAEIQRPISPKYHRKSLNEPAIRTADLRLWFRLYRLLVFLCGGSCIVGGGGHLAKLPFAPAPLDVLFIK